jgi:hypothetical protein
MGGSHTADGDAAVLFALIACNSYWMRDERAARLRDLLSGGPGVSSGHRSANPDAATGADRWLGGMATWLWNESELAVEALGPGLDDLTGWTGRG